MSNPQNQAFSCKGDIKGMVTTDNFEIIDVAYPALPEQGVIVKTVSVSVDPYLRTIPLEGVVKNHTVATVVESNNDKYPVGTTIVAILPLQRYNAVSDFTGVRTINNDINATLSSYVGIFGMPGMTAYGSLIDKYGRVPVKAGDVVLVSGAAGCVGSAVGQIARALGASKVIGVAGGPEKCKLVTEKYGFDHCIDYKVNTTPEQMRKALDEAAPEGIDYYFDNTGGVVSQVVFDVLRRHARVAICGSISNYNNEKPNMVPDMLFKLVYKAIEVRGVIVYDFYEVPGFFDDFESFMEQMYRDGKLKYDETVLQGFDKIPEAFVGLFQGKNVGKMVVNV